MGYNLLYSSCFMDKLKQIDKDYENRLYEYIALPVVPIKVVLTYSNKPQLNHFERGVLSLLINSYHNKVELADKLMLDIELINLIVEKLEKKEFINSNWEVTKEGYDLYNGIYIEKISRIAYVLYDLNLNRLISNVVDPNELYTTYANASDSCKIETDAYDYFIQFTAFENQKNYGLIKEDFIDGQLKSLWKNGLYENRYLISLAKIQTEKKHYLLTTIETQIGNINGSNWLVMDPLVEGINYDLNTFVYEESVKNKKIGEIVSKLLNRRYNFTLKESSEELFSYVKNKLFMTKIKDKDEGIIGSIIKIIATMKDSSNYSYNISDKLEMRNAIRQGMLHMGDMFETILYIAVFNKNFSHTENILNSYKSGAQPLLISIASSLGFEVNDQAEKLLFIYPSSILKTKKKPETKNISSCIAWNLLIAERDSTFYFHDFAKKYPYFISMMYYYKRKYRDKIRHSIDEDECENPRLYIDILFELIEEILGYQVNYQALDTYLEGKETLYDYSYSIEYLRQKLGNHIFESSNESITKLRQSLVTAYDLFLVKSSGYISEIRSSFEDIIRNILVYFVKKYGITSDFDVNAYVKNTNDFKIILEGLGFDSEINNSINTSIEEALKLTGEVRSRIKDGISKRFINTNLRYKVQTLILFFGIYDDIVNEIDINASDLKNLFTHFISIMYIDKGHQQRKIFDYDTAKIIVEDSIKITSNLLNRTKIKFWEV